jgi:hypothetical protein
MYNSNSEIFNSSDPNESWGNNQSDFFFEEKLLAIYYCKSCKKLLCNSCKTKCDADKHVIFFIDEMRFASFMNKQFKFKI